MRNKITEHTLKRRPVTGKDLDIIKKKLDLKNATEALEESVAIALLILSGRRRSFLVEEPDGSIVRITL